MSINSIYFVYRCEEYISIVNNNNEGKARKLMLRFNLFYGEKNFVCLVFSIILFFMIIDEVMYRIPTNQRSLS